MSIHSHVTYYCSCCAHIYRSVCYPSCPVCHQAPEHIVTFNKSW